MNKIKNWFLALLFVSTTGGAMMTMSPVLTQPVSAACGDRAFLTMPAWWRGLTTGGDCKTIASPEAVGGLDVFIWKIVLNVIEMMLHLVGYLAVFFIIFGGFQYITASGNAEGAVKARKTILNAVIGLVISIGSIAIVNVFAGAL